MSHQESTTIGSMPLARAQEITAACVAHCVWPLCAREDEVQPSLPDCSLEEMLIANRVVQEAPRKERDNGDGTGSYSVPLTCDPRIIAACYALAQYGGSPAALLQAVGYRFKVNEDKSRKRRRATGARP